MEGSRDYIDFTSFEGSKFSWEQILGISVDGVQSMMAAIKASENLKIIQRKIRRSPTLYFFTHKSLLDRLNS
jgi:hypothetical protein